MALELRRVAVPRRRRCSAGTIRALKLGTRPQQRLQTKYRETPRQSVTLWPQQARISTGKLSRDAYAVAVAVAVVGPPEEDDAPGVVTGGQVLAAAVELDGRNFVR